MYCCILFYFVVLFCSFVSPSFDSRSWRAWVCQDEKSLQQGHPLLLRCVWTSSSRRTPRLRCVYVSGGWVGGWVFQHQHNHNHQIDRHLQPPPPTYIYIFFCLRFFFLSFSATASVHVRDITIFFIYIVVSATGVVFLHRWPKQQQQQQQQ